MFLGRLRRPAVVLHYHSLGDIPREHDPHHLAVEVGTFRRHLASLRRRGYEFLTLSEFAARMPEGEEPPDGICALTFDDGTQDNLLLPELLAEAGAKATVYVCPGLLGEPHADYAPEAGMRMLTEQELLELDRHDSIEIGSHTMRHTPLDDATPEAALREMEESKGALERMLGHPVPSFAYPLCAYSEAAPEAARRAGYTSAVTCGLRGGWKPFELKRDSLTSLDGRFVFALKSRRMWKTIYRSRIGRLARAIAARRRHGPASEPGSASRIAHNAGILMVGDIAAKVASLAFYVALARFLGVQGFGEFAFALSLSVVLVTISGFGLDALLAREVSRDRLQIAHLMWDSMVAKAVFGLIAVAATVAIVALAGYREDVRVAAALLATATVVELMGQMLGSVFQGVERMSPIAISSIVQRGSTAVFAIPGMALGWELPAISAVYLLGALLGFAYNVGAFERMKLRPPLRISGRGMRALVIASIPMGLSGIFATALYRIDSTILAFLKDNTAVGLYGSGYRLLDSTLFISFFLVAAMFPALSRLDRTTTPTAAEAFALGSKVLVAVLVPLGIVFTAYAQPIVDTLYGSEFSEAASVVQLLGGAAVFYGLAYLASWMLLAQNRERLLPWLIGGAALLNLALNFILIPPLSEDGAAIATTASEAAVAIAGIVLVVQGTGRVSARRILLGTAVASAGMTITALALGANFPSLVVAGVVYAALLVVSERRLYPSDVRAAVAAVLPRGGGQGGQPSD